MKKGFFLIRKTAFKVFCLVILFVLLFFLFAFQIELLRSQHSKVFPQTIQELVKQRDVWRGEMRQNGSLDFYNKLKDVYNYSGIQHAVAHLFGELLYELEGVDGVVVCDESFFYGCFHSFMSKAVAENGIEILGQINEYCLDKFGGRETGCQHGLGHAILQFRGLSNLSDALKDCDSFRIGSGSCKTGVFMEFNLPIIEGAGGVDVKVRELIDEDYYYPCYSVDEADVDECVLELPRWWMMLKNEDIKEIGLLCDGLPDEYKSYCFEAIGQQLDLHDVSVVRSGCDLMPNRSARVDCLVGGSWGVFSWPGRKDESLLVCEGLSDQERKKCPSIIEVELGYKNR